MVLVRYQIRASSVAPDEILDESRRKRTILRENRWQSQLLLLLWRLLQLRQLMHQGDAFWLYPVHDDLTHSPAPAHLETLWFAHRGAYRLVVVPPSNYVVPSDLFH
jgi:hypothetical protein